jgi:hypothetical protein
VESVSIVTNSGILIALAIFDLLILAVVYRVIQAYAPLNRQTLTCILAGLAGFVFHAFMFFSGGFLILQLATNAGLIGICLYASRKPVNRKL